jgi:glycosyltransferase involved in cell wall biosynthesis
MKILEIISYFAPEYGGSNKAVYEESRALVREGVDVTVYTTNISKSGKLQVPLDTCIIKEGVKIYYYNIGIIRKWYFSSQLLFSLLNTIRNFDIVKIHGLYTFPSFISSFLCRSYRIPYIVTPFGSLNPYIRNKNKILKTIYWNFIDKWSFNSAYFVHYISKDEMTQSHVPMHIKSPAKIFRYGIDLEEYSIFADKSRFRHKHNQLLEKKIVLFLGRLSPEKGLDVLIPAFKQITNLEKNIQLVLIGPSTKDYEKQINDWITQLNLSQYVTIIGPLYGTDKLEAYADADIFVLPSYSEAMSMSSLEAMACGLPIIISNNTSICNEVREANAGIITNNSIQEISDAILFLLKNEELAREMGKNGRNLINNKFSWQIVAKNMKNEFTKILYKNVEIL